MAAKITRRRALLGASAAMIYPVARGGQQAPSGESEQPAKVFAHGVASGDPDESSVIIWTRISAAKKPVSCRWLVATDDSFLNIVASGIKQANKKSDYTVKVLVSGLAPGQTYYYKFEAPEEISATGRTRTLPVGHLDNLTLAVATCSNYPFGYFNAYDAIARDENIDLVLHLGDYIYEYGVDSYGGDTGRTIGRSHEPAHEIVSLADYRQRHAQYKSDPASMAMHAQHPLIVIWDDHESANNPWMGGAQNHQNDEGSWSKRRAVSLQAYYEWLPIRDPGKQENQAEYWRHYKFGDLASIITLESRHTGRAKQIEYGDHLDKLKTPEQALKFKQSILANPERKFLSDRMQNFLAAELAESVTAKRRWRLIGNQSVMAKSTSPRLDAPFFKQLAKQLEGGALRRLEGLTQLGELALPGDLDAWDGYPAAREEFYQIAREANATDLLVLSGDSHSFWQNQLFDVDNHAMGIELGSTGISSPRSLLAFGEEGLKRFDQASAADNKEIVWADGRHRGFIRLKLDHQKVHADYIAVSNVSTPQYTTRVIRSVDIVKVGETLAFNQ